MKAPDKIYVCIPQRLNLSTFNEDSKYVGMAYTDKGNLTSPQIEEYIRKDALLEWAEKELDRLYELIPDASNENPSQMELRYLGQYMQTEILIDKLNSL